VSCLPLLIFIFFFSLFFGIYFFGPFRTNILLFGTDFSLPDSTLARSDTIILTTFLPSKSYAGTLSIPRDLWVEISGVGENRINTAFFFAEASEPGAGAGALLRTIQENFGIDVKYYFQVRFEGVRDIVDAFGGVDITLDKPIAGYSIGTHHFTGRKALAFARHRSGSDDFFRMEQGQILLKSLLRQLKQPRTWLRLPLIIYTIQRHVTTNLPWWHWPRLAITLLLAETAGIDSRMISREMVTPYVTDQGASVLLPNWASIQALITNMFGK
jgi:LCP family protein required for cell wall assembly